MLKHGQIHEAEINCIHTTTTTITTRCKRDAEVVRVVCSLKTEGRRLAYRFQSIEIYVT